MRFITIFYVLLFSVKCFGQVDTTVVPFVSYWSEGDSYDFRVIKIKQQSTDGVITKNDSSSYDVKFTVLKETEKSYQIKWSYETNLMGDYQIPEKLLNKFKDYKMTEVIYNTNEVGEFLGIENWKAISKMMKSLFSDLITVLVDEGEVSEKDMRKMMDPVTKIYESKDGIEQLVFKELHYFHFPFGLEYSLSEPILYEELMPNMFGGDPIRGDAKIYFKDVDFENTTCVMIQEMSLNPDDTRDLISGLFKKMKVNDKEFKKEMAAAEFDIKDYNRYEYYYYPGVPINITTSRKTIIDIAGEKGERLDQTIIQLLN